MLNHGIENRDLDTRLELLGEREAVDVDEWRELLAQAAALCPGQPVGIQIGSEVQVNHTGVLGYLVLNSDTLGDALETYLLCERHFYSINFAQLHCNDAGWTLDWPDQLGNSNSLFVEVALTALFTFLRQRFAGACRLTSVNFTGEKPGNTEYYEYYFGCPVLFGSNFPGLTFDATDVCKSVQGALSGEFSAMHRQQLNAFSSVIKIEGPFLQRMQHVLLKQMPEGSVSLPRVAAELHCSPRSLQRRLSAYNLSYQALLDGVREELARRYLLRTSLSLTELALLLGYSDQSAFTRAFSNWTGISPGRFRATSELT